MLFSLINGIFKHTLNGGHSIVEISVSVFSAQNCVLFNRSVLFDRQDFILGRLGYSSLTWIR